MMHKNKADTLKIRETKYPYYQWLGYDYELNDLIYVLKDKGILTRVKGFRNLFRPVKRPFKYYANAGKVDDLVIVFDILKDKSLIKPKILSGHFTPLARYGVDNEESTLFRKPPNKIHEYLKRDNNVYVRIRDKYEEMIHQIAQRSIMK